jgi:hypothetical protein
VTELEKQARKIVDSESFYWVMESDDFDGIFEHHLPALRDAWREYKIMGGSWPRLMVDE